jgi:hypothetical protein
MVFLTPSAEEFFASLAGKLRQFTAFYVLD